MLKICVAPQLVCGQAESPSSPCTQHHALESGQGGACTTLSLGPSNLTAHPHFACTFIGLRFSSIHALHDAHHGRKAPCEAPGQAGGNVGGPPGQQPRALLPPATGNMAAHGENDIDPCIRLCRPLVCRGERGRCRSNITGLLWVRLESSCRLHCVTWLHWCTAPLAADRSDPQMLNLLATPRVHACAPCCTLAASAHQAECLTFLPCAHGVAGQEEAVFYERLASLASCLIGACVPSAMTWYAAVSVEGLAACRSGASWLVLMR